MLLTEKNDLSLIRAELRSDSLAGPPEWLKGSYENPALFWAGLCGLVEPGREPRKSIAMKAYDFYHDMVDCYPSGNGPAFRWYDEKNEAWQSLTRQGLKNSADLIAESWALCGLEPGSHICLIHPMGPDLVIKLAASLKMGLIISMLPPHGDRFLSRRIGALKPDFIDAAYEARFRLKVFEDIFIQPCIASDSTHKTLRSFAYKSGEPLFIIFDPSSDQPALPVTVTSDTGYLCPLRDGLISLGLSSGQNVSAPGFHDQQVQPWLLLAALLCGFTYTHISLESLEKNPELLDDSTIHALGVSAGLRSLALRSSDCINGPFSTWFRCPDDDPNSEGWQLFSQLECMRESRGAVLKWKPSLAGCELFSPQRINCRPIRVFPAAGLSFELEPPPFTGDGMPGSYGSPVLNGPGVAVTSTSLLETSVNGWSYLCSRVYGKKGRTFPGDEVLDLLKDREITASITLFPSRGTSPGMQVILMVFSPDKAGDQPDMKTLRDLITRRLTPEFAPDAVYIYPLLPPLLDDGTVDHHWCRDQFISGQLKHKSCNELNLCFSSLRLLIRTDV